MLKFLEGKKTYIGAALVALGAFLEAIGKPDLARALLGLGGALGLAGLRSAIGKVE